MHGVPSARIRNVALVGHTGSGKTTLAEALLRATGTIGRVGRVEDGTTVCDFEPEELRHHASLMTSIAPVLVGEYKLNLFDTPGFADFLPEVELALSVADVAVVVVSAVDGVEVQTEAIWQLAERAGVPRIVFVNKLDRERAAYERTLEQLREMFGPQVAPLELPIGGESGLRGIVDLLLDEAFTYDGERPVAGPVPADMAAAERKAHDDLVEGIVVADDQMTERYLGGDIPSNEELERLLATGVGEGRVFPVVCGSATAGVGLERLLELTCEVPPRRHVVARAGDRTVEVDGDASGEPLAQAFKTVLDPFVGKITLLKVLSGTLRPDITLTDTATRSDVHLHVLETVRGKELVPVGEAVTGDVVAVPKLADVHAGDTLAPRSTPVVVSPPPAPSPVHAIAVRPRTTGDDDHLMEGLHKLQQEDRALFVRRDDETHQTVVAGMGEMHLQVVLERLRRKCGVEVEVEEVRVPYRETVTASAQAEGRHRKQTGGHGQFAVVHLRVEPLPRGEGLEFVDEIVGGAIPRQFVPAVEKGVRRAMAHGGAYGLPVVDVKVTCDDGKAHSVDSSEASFELAAQLAFALAVEQASPAPLEPVSRVEVTVPARLQGDVLGDLNARRGRVLSNEPGETGGQRIVALVPTSELAHYGVDLRAATGGRGSFVAAFDHYAELPGHLVAKLSSKLDPKSASKLAARSAASV
ncbi:MAG: elongation factor [Acidimicrobiaceae bacterium]|nr:elongation factor [Acidimicrobiaceae bacterium]